MNKKLDLAIVDAIRSIIEATEYDVTYDTHKGYERVLFKKDGVETVSVNIVLRRVVPKDSNN